MIAVHLQCMYGKQLRIHFVGKQTYFKIYSGLLNSDTRIWNQSKEIEERFGGIFVPRGKKQISIKITAQW